VPILYSPITTPGLPPEEAPSTRVVIDWAAPDRTVIRLTDCPGGVDVGRDRGGEDMPPVEFVEDMVVDGDGSYPRGVRATPRTILLPIIVHAEDHATWRAIHQHVAKCLSPFSSGGVPRLGQLRYWQPDGSVRHLECAYAGGAEGSGINDRRGLFYRLWAAQFRAFEPWWWGETQSVSWWHDPGTGFFPIMPVELATPSVLGTLSLDVAGDVETGPIWTITGPADGDVSLESVTLDRVLTLDLSGSYALSAGQAVTVDMRRGHQAITGPAGTSWWAARVGTPQMWQLQPGVNDLEISVTGAATGTHVDLTYSPKYLTA
jgi:hypothetical protein